MSDTRCVFWGERHEDRQNRDDNTPLRRGRECGFQAAHGRSERERRESKGVRGEREL